VRIVNFVAKATIEEGMLSVLSFKRSLSAGVLDGSASEISLGGSRLNRFMKEVEQVTGKMGESEALQAAEGNTSMHSAMDAMIREEEMGADNSADRSSTSPQDLWHNVLTVGTQLLNEIITASQANVTNEQEATEALDTKEATSNKPAKSFIEYDATTGKPNLKIPLPPPETLQQVANLLSGFADSLKRKLKVMKVLVTGTAGFIGSAIYIRLLRDSL